jgi:hypothetical protein
LRNPFIAQAFDLHRTLGGAPGMGGLGLANAACEAIDVVTESVAWRETKRHEEAARKRGAK